MNKNFKMSILLVVFSLLITACAKATPDAASTNGGEPTDDTVSISGGGTAAMVNFPDENNHTVSLNIGDTMVVNIPTIPSEGWDWIVQDIDSGILSQVGESLYKMDAGANEAGGIVTLTFKAISPGTSILTLIYATQSADQSSPSMFSSSYGLTVNVK
ncbi:MAG: protease inhibitor I42 family protein [Chloroflexota bacterium]